MQRAQELLQQTDKYTTHNLKPFGLELRAETANDFTALLTGDFLKELVQTYHLVLLRGFRPVVKTHLVDYAKTIGPLLEWEFGAVMEMRAHETPANYLFTHGPVPFHWDGAFHQVPRFLLFHCIEAPNPMHGGETLFTNTQLIWQQASANERSEWSRHTLQYATEKLAHYGGVIKVPLVQTHPDTTEKIIRYAEPVPATMLNPVTVSVDEVDVMQSTKIIADMAARCYREEVCYAHAWQQHDFLLADNHALIHGRRAYTEFSPRHLRRIQII